MKKLTRLVLLALIISFVGCQEEANENEKALDKEKPEIDVLYYNNGKSEQAKMLVFRDIDTFRMIYSTLLSEVDNWDNAFIEEWGYLDDEALNAKEAAINFDAEKPLTDFEKEYNFNSMRLKFIAEHEEWLNHEELDIENDPMNKYPWDAVDMTLMNTDGVFKIGSSIFVWKQDRKIEIKNGDLNILESILNSDEQLNNKNVVIIYKGTDKTTGCLTGWDDSEKWYYLDNPGNKNDYRMKCQWEYGQNHIVYKDYLKAKTWSYKRKKVWGKWRWKAYRMTIEARIQGYNSLVLGGEDDCSYPHYINVAKRERRSIIKKYEYGVSPYSHYKRTIPEGELKSIHKQKFNVTRWFGNHSQ